MIEKPPAPGSAPISEDEFLEIRHAYHSLEAFQLSPEHRKAKEALKVRLAEKKPEKGETAERNREE